MLHFFFWFFLKASLRHKKWILQILPFFKLSRDLFSPVWLTRSRGTGPCACVAVTAETSLNRLRIWVWGLDWEPDCNQRSLLQSELITVFVGYCNIIQFGRDYTYISFKKKLINLSLKKELWSFNITTVFSEFWPFIICCLSWQCLII